MTARQAYVAVCGPGEASPEELAWAEAVGRGLAEGGAVVLTGGLGGVMDAAARGAAAAGGVSIGLLPNSDRDRDAAVHTYTIATGLGEMRNALLVRAADAVVAVSGEFGTLSEVAFALKTGVPVVGLHTWELRKAGAEVTPFEVASDPEDAVARALRLAGTSGDR